MFRLHSLGLFIAPIFAARNVRIPIRMPFIPSASAAATIDVYSYRPIAGKQLLRNPCLNKSGRIKTEAP